jgi:hypothetical protein
LGLAAGRSAPFYCVPSPNAGLILDAFVKRKQCGLGRVFKSFVKSNISDVWINMAAGYSSSDESDVWVVPDPDARFELRLSEAEKGKNELWTLYNSGAETGLAHINHVLDALGFLYGERVRDEVRGGLRWLLADPESLSQIGLIVGLRERHMWFHDGHFNVLEWGSVDLYAYLEKYGIECSGVIDRWAELQSDARALCVLHQKLTLVHGGYREHDFRFLYDTVFPTYGTSLETVLTILRGKYDLFPFWQRSARRIRDQRVRDPVDWSDVLDSARYVLKSY